MGWIRIKKTKEPVWPLVLFILFAAIVILGIKYTSKIESAPDQIVMHLWYDYEENVPRCVVVEGAGGSQTPCKVYERENPGGLKKLRVENKPPRTKI